MSYGVLVVLAAPDDTWPSKDDYRDIHSGRYPILNNPAIDRWRDRLNAWHSPISEQVKGLGARSLLSFTPLSQPAVAQVNVWIDQASDDLEIAMSAATDLALSLQNRGHSIDYVTVLDWAHNPVIG